jgi:hypothetical protein
VEEEEEALLLVVGSRRAPKKVVGMSLEVVGIGRGLHGPLVPRQWWRRHARGCHDRPQGILL